MAPEGFTTIKIRVVAPDGTVVERCVLVADSDVLRGRGLMGVTDPTLGGIDAMVFTYDRDTTSGFWMKNTLVPLSIAFADEGGTVTSTAEMEPCPAGTDPCPVTTSPSAYRVAVEVPQGRLAALGLVPGGRIETLAGTGCTVGRN
ncbi:MAG TPA: DUF192 domain-containing protein [Acidimicrobiales bacterium]